MLKNAHLLRSPAASPSWRRGKKSLLIRRDATLILPLASACLPKPRHRQGHFWASWKNHFSAACCAS